MGAAIVVVAGGFAAWGPASGSTNHHLVASYQKRATVMAGAVCLKATTHGLMQYSQRDSWVNSWTNATVVFSALAIRVYQRDCTTPVKAAFSDFYVVRSGAHCTWMTHATCGGRFADRADEPFTTPVKTAIVSIDSGIPVQLRARSYVGSAPAACLHVATWVAGTTGTRPFNAAFDLAACTPRP